MVQNIFCLFVLDTNQKLIQDNLRNNREATQWNTKRVYVIFRIKICVHYFTNIIYMYTKMIHLGDNGIASVQSQIKESLSF